MERDADKCAYICVLKMGPRKIMLQTIRLRVQCYSANICAFFFFFPVYFKILPSYRAKVKKRIYRVPTVMY